MVIRKYYLHKYGIFWQILAHMQQICQLCTAGNQLHVLTGDGLEADSGDKVNHNGNTDAYHHAQSHPEPGVSAYKAGSQTVDCPGTQTHESAGENRAGEDTQKAGATGKGAAHEEVVDGCHVEIADKSAHGSAVYIDFRSCNQEPVDDDFKHAAADEGEHGELFLAG